MTDDVIHSTQYYIMCISWAILANLQRRSLKPGRLIVLQETHVRLQKLLLPWQLTLCQSPPTWFQYVSDFQLEKRYTRPQIQEKHIYMLVGSCISGTICKYENWMPRGPEMSLILGRSGTQYVAMAIKLLSSKCGAHLVESSCKESNISDSNWLRYLFSSYLIKTWLSIWRHQLANLHTLKTWISLQQKEIFENSKQHFSSHAGYLFVS